MTYTVRFAPEARQQLDAIEDYIAFASGHADVAAQYVDEIVDYCESFETFPERGMRRDDLLLGLRVIGYRQRATIAFRVDAASRSIVILGVFYGARTSKRKSRIPTLVMARAKEGVPSQAPLRWQRNLDAKRPLCADRDYAQVIDC